MIFLLTVHILIWISIWIGIWGIFFVFFRKRKIDYIHRYGITILYFLSSTILIFSVFWRYFITFVQSFHIVPFYFLFLFYLIAFSLYAVSQKSFRKSILHWKQQETITSYSPLFDYRYLLSKSAEILFQQTAIVLLIAFIQSSGLSLNFTVFIFTLVFGSTHLPLLLMKKFDQHWYSLIILASFGAGVIFSVMIVTISYGFVFTYIIHWCFYLFAGIVMNIKKNNELNALTI